MKSPVVLALAAMMAFLTVTPNAFARTYVGGGFFDTQAKDNVRWTLADWLQQKKNFSLMDQWLALNSQARLFEINLGGGRSDYDLEVGGNTETHSIDRFSATLWISIFGLEFEQTKSDEDTKTTSGQLNVRLFGQSSQSTYLTAHYGVRKWEDEAAHNEVENQYAGAKLNIYIIKYFGLEGMYRKYFSAKDSVGKTHEAERAEYGAFIDVYFVRLYGNAFKETTDIAGQDRETRDGIDAGVKFYF